MRLSSRPVVQISNLTLHISRWWWKSPLPRYVSIKIATLDINTTRETMISRVIAEADPSDEALSFIRTPIYELEVVGPEGTHPCLVYTPMRETLFKLRRRFRRQRLAPPLFKFVMHCVLSGLDYLHSKCRVIHTGQSRTPPFPTL